MRALSSGEGALARDEVDDAPYEGFSSLQYRSSLTSALTGERTLSCLKVDEEALENGEGADGRWRCDED